MPPTAQSAVAGIIKSVHCDTNFRTPSIVIYCFHLMLMFITITNSDCVHNDRIQGITLSYIGTFYFVIIKLIPAMHDNIYH
jgi:hypothetical protein